MGPVKQTRRRGKNLLSDVAIRNARKKPTLYRLYDGEGLVVDVLPSGIKTFRLRYKLDDAEQTATIGRYGSWSLDAAREEADRLRKVAQSGQHLTVAKRVARAKAAADHAATFGKVADAWIRKRRAAPWSQGHREQVRASIDRHLKELKPLPVGEITALVVSPILDGVERAAPLMFEKVRQRLYRIMDHAVGIGAIERNPLPKPEPERRRDRRHFPAVTELPGLGAILRSARAADPCKGIARAHVLLAFTGQRVSEVVAATWDEFDLKVGTWAIPRERMKRKDAQRGPHVVPLPPALLATLREWHKTDGDAAALVCPAPRDATKAVTPEGCEKFYRDHLGLAGKHSPHSWRSAFSTVAREAGKDGDAVEAQLDHTVGTKVSSAYDRAHRLDLRRALMTWYEATLLAARDGSDVVPIKRRA